MFRPRKQNTRADALTRRLEDNQRDAVQEARLQTLLKPDQLDPRIAIEIATLQTIQLAPISGLQDELTLIDQVLKENRTSNVIANDRVKAKDPKQVKWQLQDGLLLYKGRLVVLDVDYLHTRLITEAHS